MKKTSKKNDLSEIFIPYGRQWIDDEDIEEVIIKHPAVSEVAIFGIPDEKWGEIPIAAVILHKEQNVVEEDLKTWINQRVDAKFQRVADVQVLEDFPRNIAGKTLKREMREIYVNN